MPQARQFGHCCDIAKRDWLSRLPDRPDQTFTGRHAVQAQKTFQRSKRRRGLVQDVARHLDQRRTTLGKKYRHKFVAAAIGEIKRATMGIENPRRALDNQPVQIVRLDRLTKGFSQSVQKIEDESFFDLDLFLRSLEGMNFPALPKGGKSPAQN